jgi:hypothetical protein
MCRRFIGEDGCTAAGDVWAVVIRHRSCSWAATQEHRENFVPSLDVHVQEHREQALQAITWSAGCERSHCGEMDLQTLSRPEVVEPFPLSSAPVAEVFVSRGALLCACSFFAPAVQAAFWMLACNIPLKFSFPTALRACEASNTLTSETLEPLPGT